MNSFCSYFNEGKCRSCEWIEKDYSSQIAVKEGVLRAALAFLSPFQLEPSVLSAPKGFRNRAKMIVTGTVQAPLIGLAGDEMLDVGRELLQCPIHHPRLNEVFSALPEFIRMGNLIPYQIVERRGELKGLIAFYSPESGQMYLRFVLRSKECVARIKKILPSLQERFPFLTVVSANIQSIPHAILEGPEEIVLTEKSSIEHKLGDLTLHLAPQAFVQTNSEVSHKLYAQAAAWIDEAAPERMLELYCGQGAFSFFAARSCSSIQAITGIELNPDAVASAEATAKALGLRQLSFKVADASSVEAETQRLKPELVLVNPPRRGLGETLGLIQRFAPEHLIYSSCEVETLAEDLKKLVGKYRIRKIQLFDMFPHTRHFETLVWATHKPE